MIWKGLYLVICLYQIQETIQQSPVTGLKHTSLGIDNVRLTWDAYREARGYELKYYEYPQGAAPKSKTITAAQNTYILDGLISGTAYQVYVQAILDSEKKYSLASVKEYFVTEGPKPVLLVSVTNIKTDEATVTWTPAEGEDYDEFVVVLLHNNTITQEIKLNKVFLQYTFSKLPHATPYGVQVIVKKDGKPSTAKKSGFQTGMLLDNVRNLGSESVETSTATISWTPPIDATHVSKFDIEYSISDESSIKNTATISRSPLLLSNLQPGKTYGYRVRTVGPSPAIHSPWTNVMFFTTIAETISQPTDLTLTNPNTDSVEVTWKAPDTNSKIKNYIIKYYQKQPEQRPMFKPTEIDLLRHKLTGLESGTYYTIAVQAVTAFGTLSQYSTAKPIKTIGPKPVSSPLIITEITVNSAKVSWIFKTNPNHDSVTMQLKNNDDQTMTPILIKNFTDTSVLLTDLKSNTPFTVYVETRKGGETSSKVELGFRTSLKEGDGQLKIETVKTDPIVGKVLITFNKLEQKLVEKYQVRVELSHELGNNYLTKNVTSITVSTVIKTYLQLTSGYEFFISARAIFPGDIAGPYSTKRGTIIPYGRPPNVVQIGDITDKAATISWPNPYSGQSILHKYMVSYMNLDDPSENSTVETRYNVLQFKNLKADTRYRVFVSTKLNSDKYNGTATIKSFRSGLGLPPQPLFTKVVPYKDTAVITWQRIPQRKDITGYEISLHQVGEDEKETTQFSTSAITHSFTFRNLVQGETYFARVRAVVMDKIHPDTQGLWSVRVPFTINGYSAVIPTPADVKITKTSGQYIMLEWDPIPRRDIIHYELKIQSIDNDVTITEKAQNTNKFQVKNLNEKTSYTITMRAVALYDRYSQWTAPISFTTTKSEISTLSTPQTVGIAVAVILLLVILIIAILIYRRKKNQSFSRFDGGNVSFSKNNGHSNGISHDNPNHEMDNPSATAIKKGHKLYT